MKRGHYEEESLILVAHFGDRDARRASGISLKIVLSYRGPTEDQQDWNPPQNSIIMAIRVGDSVKLTHQRLEAVVDTLDCMC